ncbi:FAD-dependent oxidoreductase [Bradyrhizobium sp. SSUT112]|uniref:FAD-dependent oxidoreductase n=1 Tax=Bradyrhizobium sp. SSUT112 TaxID=3040604 RepID=UPI0024484688|nr:FAD-dependent oxidoreductase [Bradyrhizobium sp. SSUT112]MDH2356503.1 FAD-dependent oxidoreductase [Bradyrhizobium sp. SSUT112]
MRERAQLLVVGAGPAGLAAALEAARQGLQVVLVDEHPVDHAMMGIDVPLHFGQRMSSAVRNRGRMLERLVEADPQIAEAFEAGIDVRLGTSVWGLFVHQPGLRWVRGCVAGLTQGEDVWFVRFDTAILATGRRDVGLAFPGWDLPGVMGVTAADALLRRYDALDGQDFIIIGSGAEATTFGMQALQNGRRVVALVEAGDVAVDNEGSKRLAAAGVPVFTESMIARADGGAEGLRGATIVALNGASETQNFRCDTVVLASGVAPVVELFDVAGAQIVFRPEGGGHVAATDIDGRTTVPMLFAAGDCTGINAEKTCDWRVAAEEGRRAARAAAASLGCDSKLDWLVPTAVVSAVGTIPERIAWANAELAVADDGVYVCQCEEVSATDLIGVRPPRYLDRSQPAMRARSLATLAADGSVNQDQIKRLTRAGMGLCQGRRCREQVGAILAAITRTPLGAIPLPSYRAPVRPLPLSAFAVSEEPASLAKNWDVWFGIESQFQEPQTKRGETEEIP